MNKLKTTFSAGVDFNWDDLEWIQASVRDALYGLLSAFGIDADESFILSGCVVTVGPSSASTTAGYISLNGEILKVEAHSISYDGSSPIVWRLSDTDDATGTEQDSNGATVQCYQKRVAILYQAASYTNEMPYNADNLSDVIASKLDINTDWIEIPYNAAYFSGTNLVMDGSLTKMYYKVIGKVMIFSYNLRVTSMDSSILDIDIASATGYRISRSSQNTGLRTMSANNGPILALAIITGGPYANLLRITEYSGNLAALASASINGQIILDVAPI